MQIYMSSLLLKMRKYYRYVNKKDVQSSKNNTIDKAYSFYLVTSGINKVLYSSIFAIFVMVIS